MNPSLTKLLYLDMPPFRYYTILVCLLLTASILPAPIRAQGVTFGLSGGQTITEGDGRFYAFDVDLHASESGTQLAAAAACVNYNSDVFGDNAEAGGAVQVSAGSLLGDATGYAVSATDDGQNRVCFYLSYSGSAASAATVPDAAAALFAVKMELRPPSSGTFPAGLSFESALMDGEQFGYDAQGGWLMFSPVVATDTDNSDVTVSGTSLPVELTAFDAVRSGGDVVLRWATATEQHNAGFHVEHALPAEGEAPAFEAVAFVPGAGTTTEPQRYTNVVAGLEPGRHVFRLRQVDVDGGFEYSPEVAIEVVPEALTLSEPYPNPFNPQTQFAVTLPQTQRLTVSVYNVLGQRVAVLFDGVAEAGRTERLRFDASALPSGTYLITAVAESSVLSKTVTLLK